MMHDRRQGVAGNQIAQLPIGRQQHPVDRREIEREQQQHEGVDEKPEKPFPVLDTEEEQNCACKQVIDVQVARDPEHPDRIKLPEADDQDQRDRNEVFAEPMPERQNESRNDQHHIIDVEQPQPAQVIERRDHDVRQAARDARISRDIDAALASYDLRIARHDSGRDKPVEPGRERKSPLWLTPDQVAQPCHAAPALEISPPPVCLAARLPGSRGIVIRVLAITSRLHASL